MFYDLSSCGEYLVGTVRDVSGLFISLSAFVGIKTLENKNKSYFVKVYECTL